MTLEKDQTAMRQRKKMAAEMEAAVLSISSASWRQVKQTVDLALMAGVDGTTTRHAALATRRTRGILDGAGC